MQGLPFTHLILIFTQALGIGLSIVLKAERGIPDWLWGAVAQCVCVQERERDRERERDWSVLRGTCTCTFHVVSCDYLSGLTFAPSFGSR